MPSLIDDAKGYSYHLLQNRINEQWPTIDNIIETSKKGMIELPYLVDNTTSCCSTWFNHGLIIATFRVKNRESEKLMGIKNKEVTFHLS